MQRYFVKGKKDNLLELEKSDLHHLKNVMRCKVGDKIECVYEKNLYICSIDDLSSCWVSILSEEKGGEGDEGDQTAEKRRLCRLCPDFAAGRGHLGPGSEPRHRRSHRRSAAKRSPGAAHRSHRFK